MVHSAHIRVCFYDYFLSFFHSFIFFFLHKRGGSQLSICELGVVFVSIRLSFV